MFTRLALLLLLALAPMSSIAGENQNVEVVKKMAELINQRDLDTLHTVVADDVVRHSDATPGVIVTNLDEFIAFLETDIAALPDSVQKIDMIFSAGDKVALRARYSGTQTGQMGPFPPSGKIVDLVFIAILRIENEKIAEIWVEWDNLSILSQLGHLQPAQSE